MQLPRGKFREIKKSERISSILEEFERTNFSGICSISSGPVSGTLVFKSGKCILAKILHKSGDGALEELQKMSNLEVDAALSSLDEAQIQLALEFNKACRIIKAGKTASVSVLQTPAVQAETTKKIFSPTHITAPTEKPDAIPKKPAPLASNTLRPSSSFTAPPAHAKKIIPPPQARAPATPPPVSPVFPSLQKPAADPLPSPEPKKPDDTEQPDDESSNFEKDIDTFDTLDLDNVTDKIRNDCKTMVRQLQLEHLMER